jgi:hypothetical protein
MPTSQRSTPSCGNSDSRAHASQRKGQAQEADGNGRAERFSIDWPPMFVSRTSNPADPCYLGRRGGELNRCHAPAEASVIVLSQVTAGKGRYRPPEQRTMQGKPKQ